LASSLGRADVVAQERVSDDELIFLRGCANSNSASIVFRGPNTTMLDEMVTISLTSLCCSLFLILIISSSHSSLYFFFLFMIVSSSIHLTLCSLFLTGARDARRAVRSCPHARVGIRGGGRRSSGGKQTNKTKQNKLFSRYSELSLSLQTALNIYIESVAMGMGSRQQLAVAEFAAALLAVPRILAINGAHDAVELVARLRAQHNKVTHTHTQRQRREKEERKNKRETKRRREQKEEQQKRNREKKQEKRSEEDVVVFDVRVCF
jgi:hypothetical protein